MESPHKKKPLVDAELYRQDRCPPEARPAFAGRGNAALQQFTGSFIVAIVVMAVTASAVNARGQRSYQLPERVLAVDASRRPPPPAVWNATIDAASPLGPALAPTPDAVVFARGKRICAVASADGTPRWCSSVPGDSPVYAAGVVAFLDARGMVYAVDARTGRARWRSDFGAAAGWRPGVPSSATARLWTTGSTLLVAGALALPSSSGPRYGELSFSGTVLWSAHLSGAYGPPFLLNRYALQPFGNSGATIDAGLQVVRLGAHGGFGSVFEASAVLGTWHGNAIVVSGSRAPYGEDTFLSRDIDIADIPTGHTVQYLVLEPDYEANLAANRSRDSSRYNDMNAAEGQYVYTTVAGNLYRYDLHAGADQRPLLLNSRAPYVGGPVHGTVYVTRREGVWALTPEQSSVAARLVVATSSPVVAFTALWPNAYIAFADGSLRGVDVRDGSTTLTASGCNADRIVADSRQAFFVCTGNSWRLLAFTPIRR